MTDLKSFLAAKPSVVKPAPVSAEPPTEENHLNSDSDAGAQTVYRNTTPSGIEVEYEAHPKRLYRVNGAEVPSVTTVLDCLSKQSLPWWGMQVGVRGVLELLERRVLQSKIADHGELWTISDEPATDEAIVKALTAEKLTVNHVVNRAADRGVAVHDALEQWAQTGGEFFPTPQNYPDEERPYVEGLLKFLDACNGSLKPTMCEVMVGSPTFGFAGRYDLVVELWESVEVVAKSYKRKQDKTVTLNPGVFLVDLKTSKGVYPTHALQLAAYELASIEGGYPATDHRAVLHVTADGAYEFVLTQATADDFLSVLRTHQTMKREKEFFV